MAGCVLRRRAPFSRISSNWENGARISVEEPGVASCRLLRDNGMASVSQFNPYHCDQCGTANIVAAPVLFEQGTRTYSGTFYSGKSQSFSAQSVAPPCTRGYIRPFLLWGPLIIIFLVWTLWCWLNSLSPGLFGTATKYSCCLLVAWPLLSCWADPQSSENSVLQPRVYPDSVGIGSTPISAGVAENLASYLPSA